MARIPIRNQPLLTPEELAGRLDEFYKSIEEFNDGYYFESHETLEDLWMVTPWPERQFFQAIIQLAAALVHLVRGEYPGVIKLLDASLEKLDEFTPEFLGVNTTRLVRDVERVRAELLARGETRFLELDQSRVPTIEFKRSAPPRP